MRILICTFTYSPNRDGVATASKSMAEGFQSLGHEVSIATSFHPARGAWESGDAASPKVLQFRIEGDASSYATYHGDVSDFKRLLIEGGFDLIVTHCWHTWPTDLVLEVIESIPAKTLHVSHGFSAHVIDWHRRPPWGIVSWLRRLPYVWQLPNKIRKFDWITFLSEKCDWDRFFDHKISRWVGYANQSVIPNSVDPSFLDHKSHGFRTKYANKCSVLFICVANYCARKNQALSVRAFHRAGIPNSVLLFIGSELGEYGREVQKLDERLRDKVRTDAPRVVFLEKIDADLIKAAYAECDIFVLSAKAETQPIVLLEAMASAKPWISTDTGCVREMAGGQVIKSETELAHAMKSLAADAELRKQMGEAGKQDVIARYSHSFVLLQYGMLVEKLHRTRPSSESKWNVLH